MNSGHLGSASAEREMREVQKLRTDELRRDFGTVLQSESGRRFFWHVINDVCAVHEDIAATNSDVYRKNGRRSVGVQMAKFAEEHHFQLFQQMRSEAHHRAVEDRLRVQNAAQTAKEDNS